MSSIRDRFKKFNPAEEAANNKALAAEINGAQYSLFKAPTDGGLFEMALKPASVAGKNFIRLLPQIDGSAHAWHYTLPHLYVDPNTTPGHRGYFALTPEQAFFVTNIRRVLWNSPFKDQMYSQEQNKDGLKLDVKFKELFIGYHTTEHRPRVEILSLPSNGFQDNPKQIQAGTAIVRAMYEKDSAGELKYGNIVDLDRGRIIEIVVDGEGKTKQTRISIDRAHAIPATQDFLLEQVVALEDCVHFNDNATLATILKLTLTKDMWKFVSEKMADVEIIKSVSGRPALQDAPRVEKKADPKAVDVDEVPY